MLHMNAIGIDIHHHGAFSIQRPHGSGDWLLVIFKTDACLTLNGREIPAPPDSAVLFSPDAPQTYRSTCNAYINHFLHFISTDDSSALSHLRCNALLQPENIRELEELLSLLCRRENSPKLWGADKARYDDDIAARVLRMLEEHIYGRLTLSDITAAMGYGKTYLSNIFKRVYGKSIMDSYTQLKINEAKYLLREGSMSVSQISDSLGFSSPQYFSKRFAAMTKMSPRQYAGSVREDWTTENEGPGQEI